MGEDDAFGGPGRARGEEQEGRIVGPLPRAGSACEGAALRGGELAALLQQGVVADKLGPVVVPHAPVFVVDDAADRRAPRQDLEQLVDLFLVLGEDVGDLRRSEPETRSRRPSHPDRAAPRRRPASAPRTSRCRGAAGCRRRRRHARRAAGPAPTAPPRAQLPRRPVRARSRCARCRASFPVAPDAHRAVSNGEGAALEKYLLLLFRSPSIVVPKSPCNKVTHELRRARASSTHREFATSESSRVRRWFDCAPAGGRSSASRMIG